MPASSAALKMAVFSWITQVEREDIAEHFASLLGNLGLEIDQEVSNRMQIYARDHDAAEISQASRVSVLASWTSWQQGECQIEVRSAELILMAESRCRRIAKALMECLPPPPGARVT